MDLKFKFQVYNRVYFAFVQLQPRFKFSLIQGESLDLNIILPETSTSRPVLLALAAHARTTSRHAAVSKTLGQIDKSIQQ